MLKKGASCLGSGEKGSCWVKGYLSANGGWGEHLSALPACHVSKLPGSIWAPPWAGLWARFRLFLSTAGLGGRWEHWNRWCRGCWSALEPFPLPG